MKPLSLWTFYRRHKGRAALLLSLIALVTAGLYLMVALSWAIFVEPLRTNRLFLTKFSVVMPAYWENQPDPTVLAQVRTNPDVEEVIPIAFGVGISLPEAIGSGSSRLQLLAIMEGDILQVMERAGATLQEGELLQPRTNGIMLSEQAASSLGLQVGDIIHNTKDPDLYSQILDPMEVVAILESDVRLGIVSHEYLTSHELYRNLPLRFLVVAQQGREAAVDAFLRNEVETAHTGVWTLQKLNEEMAREYRSTYLLILPVAVIVAAAMALVVGVINRIANTPRLPEFGILHTAGHSRGWLTRRLTMETAVVALVGWLMGIVLSWLALYTFKLAVFEPRGHELQVIGLAPAVPILVVPVAVLAFTLLTVRRVFSRLDPVTIIERGLEGDEGKGSKMTRSRPSRPMTLFTFLRRNRRRTILTASAMTLLIMAIVLVVFLFTAMDDARRAGWGYLRKATTVRWRPGVPVNPAVIAQIRTHPAVDRVIHTVPVTLLNVTIPPLGSATVNPLAVYTEDMDYLIELYELQLKEGHLPRPFSNELVIPETVAQNRGLQVGDIIGDRDRPAYPGEENLRLPAKFVISGIFSRPTAVEENYWLAFFSREFLESHEDFEFSRGDWGELLVLPKEGQKRIMDDWLQTELKNNGLVVLTYRDLVASIKENTRSSLLTVALIESVVALVAAAALTILHFLSISQRRAEFGLLHALGYSRLRLVWRTAAETVFATGAAWGLSAILCLSGLLYLQFGVFTRVGLNLNLFNPTPWLFTLPIPVAVLTVTTATIAQILSRLDPVSTIERR
jgi:ABC-type lipoprotein release transport system permease subunit